WRSGPARRPCGPADDPSPACSPPGPDTARGLKGKMAGQKPTRSEEQQGASTAREEPMRTRASCRAIRAVAVALALVGGAIPPDAGAATLYTVLSDRFLMQFDSAAPGTITRLVPITGLQSTTERVLGIDFRPRTGHLFLLPVPIRPLPNPLLHPYPIHPPTP